MADSYTFIVTIEDSGDEFSGNFNCKNDKEVEEFENDIKQTIESNNWTVSHIRLKKTTTTLD